MSTQQVHARCTSGVHIFRSRPRSIGESIGLLFVFTALLSITGCVATRPWHPPIATVHSYIGRPLADFELAYGPPRNSDTMANGEHVATWRYIDPYSLAFRVCAFNVRSDASGSITGAAYSDDCAVRRN